MGDGAWDVNSIAEAEFEKVLAIYIVPDQPYDESTGPTVKRAEGTLPRNLVLKPTQAHGQPHNVSRNFMQLYYHYVCDIGTVESEKHSSTRRE